jgi:3-carboxy-cis,cis-muconate cycloisomerase
MRSNYDAAGGFALAERIRGLLTPALGPSAAHAFVKDAAQRARGAARALEHTLWQEPALATVLQRAGITPAQVAQALDPASYLGCTDTWIERALAAHAALRGRDDERG